MTRTSRNFRFGSFASFHQPGSANDPCLSNLMPSSVVKPGPDALKEMVHETSARFHLNPAGCDTAGREHSHDRRGPDVSDRGGEQPEGDRAVELVVACKLARPDSGRIRVTSNPGIV